MIAGDHRSLEDGRRRLLRIVRDDIYCAVGRCISAQDHLDLTWLEVAWILGEVQATWIERGIVDEQQDPEQAEDRDNATNAGPTPAELRAALEAIVQAWEAIPNRIDPTPQKIHDAIKAGRELLKGSSDA